MSLKTNAQKTSSLHYDLTLPPFESSPDAIRQSAKAAIEKSRKVIEEMSDLKTSELQFSNTLAKLDQVEFEEQMVFSRIHLLQSVHPNAEIRAASREAEIQFRNWHLERIYNEKIYRAIHDFAQTSEAHNLQGESKKLLDEWLLDYRRLGFELPPEEREKLKSLKKSLNLLEQDFSKNIQEHQDRVLVERERLKGLDESFISKLKTEVDGRYQVSLDYPEYLPVMEYGEDESLRKDLLEKKYKTAASANQKILKEMHTVRQKMAKILGYQNWNHFVIEKRMAQKPENVVRFLNDLEKRLRPKAEEELKSLRDLKRAHTKNPEAELKIWDYYFYSSLWKRKEFSIDTQKLKEFFPLEDTLNGMFLLFSKLFGLQFERQNASSFYQWHPEVQLIKVSDSSGVGLGYFYLDLHPREGKYGHAAAFGLIPGKDLLNGHYQRPVSAMICNFPKGTPAQPALLPHAEVETLFHEFGHILHNLLTTARFTAFSGTSVAWDFVEAPSQVLENWVWDFESLQLIAKHFQDPEKKLSKDFVERINQAEKAGSALFYIRQISLAKADLEIHGSPEGIDPIEISNRVLSQTFFEVPENSCFAAGWGHMVGYASGYYGYAWADVMAADLFSRFTKEGVLNPELGRKLRKEIYEPGSSREESSSLQAFLGRPLSPDAFFERLTA